MSVVVNKFYKSVKMWQSYGHPNFGMHYSDTTRTPIVDQHNDSSFSRRIGHNTICYRKSLSESWLVASSG